jgi:small subunit ribosomal protein S18
MQRNKRKKIIYKPLNDHCPFCKSKTYPSYKNYEELEKYITERAKLLSALRSGVCSKHQRALATEVKRARFLALLPITGATL